MKEPSKFKRLAELLRVIILQLGDDVPRARREFETYTEWLHLPESERLTGKNQAQMIDLYKTFRTRAGLGFERDVYLEQEPGDNSPCSCIICAAHSTWVPSSAAPTALGSKEST